MVCVSAAFQNVGGDAGHDRKRLNIFCDHGAGCDDRAMADLKTVQNRHASADPDVILDHDALVRDRDVGPLIAMHRRDDHGMRRDSDTIADANAAPATNVTPPICVTNTSSAAIKRK